MSEPTPRLQGAGLITITLRSGRLVIRSGIPTPLAAPDEDADRDDDR